MKRKIIFDCDPGHDDIFAILFALAHPEQFEILGFATVAGNQTLEKVSNNLANVLDYLHIDLPIYKGYDKPITKALEVQPLAHGESGLDGPLFPDKKHTFQTKHALEFYKEMLETHDQITIIAIGPLTNVALMLKTYPHLSHKIECISCMGGGIAEGNIQKRSEFNIYHDPEAAKIVFESNVPVVLNPLEVCIAGSITFDEMEAFHNDHHVSKLVDDLFGFYSKYSREHNLTSSPIFDVCPIYYLYKPELFKSFNANIYIELNGAYTRGMTVTERCDTSKTLVLYDVERKPFIDDFTQSIFELDRKINV
ncbi:nucleoside hydrolase [Anaerorhabdus sp.]|uniref:nucleoside hydrolase n=1 Tax=Anaerorhabdus sp. TaxID=1872524 RepID=UPI002FC9E7C9